MCPDDTQPEPDSETSEEPRELDQLIEQALPSTFSFFGQQARLEAPVQVTGIEPGRVIDDYRLIGLIGQGGMGQVWEAEQLSLRRRVALKLVRPDRISTHTLDLFAREARAGGRLQHAGIVTVIAHGECDGIAWICMELVEGAWTLRDSLKEVAAKAELPPDYYKKVGHFVVELADSLQVAHEAGVIHRDLKPGNVLITRGEHPKISDFGLAKITDETAISQTGEFAGTYYYMSPEQAMARRMGIDHRTDIFSLGVVLYEMLALRRPFDGDTGAQVAQQIVTKEPPSLRSIRARIPWDLAVICGKCLEKDRDRRYGTMAELAADLRRHLADEPIRARPPSVWQRTVKWSRRNPAKTASGAVALIAFAAIAVLLSINLSMNSKLETSDRDLLDTKQQLEVALRMVEELPEVQPPSKLLIAPGDSSPPVRRTTDSAIGAQPALTPIGANPALMPEELELSADEIEAIMASLAGAESILTLVPGSSLTSSPMELKRSREDLETALAVLQRTLPNTHPNVLRAQRGLAAVYSALGRLDELQRLQEDILATIEVVLPEGHPDLIRTRNALGVTLSAQGKHEEASKLQEAAISAMELAVPKDDSELLAWKANLAATYQMLDRFDDAQTLQEEIVRIREQNLDENDPGLLRARENLTATEVRQQINEAQLSLEEAALATEDGELDAGREMVAQALEDVRQLKDVRSSAALKIFAEIDGQALRLGMVGVRLEVGSWIVNHLADTRDESDITLINARNSLASALFEAGDYVGARDLWEMVLEIAVRNWGEDHPRAAVSRGNISLALYRLGKFERARTLQEAVLAAREDLPATNPRYLNSKEQYATILAAMGEIEAALEIQRDVLAIREASLEENDPAILRSRENLALILYEFSEFEGALDLLESVVTAREQSLPEGNVDLLRARNHVAVMHEVMDHLVQARMLQEAVLEVCEVDVPKYHNLRRTAQINLAVTLFRIGDLEVSRELQESVLAEAVGDLQYDHPILVKVRNNLAMTLRVMDDLDGAREFLEAVLEVREAKLPENHRELLSTRGNLALILHEDGRFEAALELEESVLTGLEKSLSANHPDVISARANLGRTLYELGEFERARGLQKTVLDALDHLPKDHPDVLQARGYLAITTHTLNDLAVAGRLLDDQLEGLQTRFEAALTASSREARAISLEETTHVSGALFLSEGSEVDRNPGLFSVLETRRNLATHSANVSHFRGARAGSLRRKVNRLSRALNALVLAGPAEDQETEEWRAAVGRDSMKLDSAQQELLVLLDEPGEFVRRIDAARVTEELPEGSAAVGYHRYDRWQIDEEMGGLQYDNPCILAMVALPDGSVKRVELGSIEDIVQRIYAWRDAVGRPIRSDRGTPLGEAGEPTEEKTAKELRRVLLDPVFAASDGATTLFVCLDDVMHLVPLDALLLEDGDRVGDRFAIHTEISFARLLAPPPPSDAGPSMLAMGNVDFNAGVVEEPAIEPERFPVAAIDTVALRSGSWGNWQKLRHTRYEIQDLEALFEDSFGTQLTPLTGKEASKAALPTAVVGKRYVHLATHSWFTPEMVHSLADVEVTAPFAQRLQDIVRGFAPPTLCGLCLAGANSGRDTRGKLPGLLTAQELSGFDLSACDLAVLSANETDVGVHRAGQGILSLQTALHAAGARTAGITLWNVQDRTAGELIKAFYENIWEHGMGKAEALWQAKRRMRENGEPVEVWAGWVLTGDPE